MGLQPEALPVAIANATSSSTRNASGLRPSREPRSKTPATARGTAAQPTVEIHLDWASRITDEEWEYYRQAIEALRQSRIPFMLGGGFAQAAFTGRWRNTKDIDFYVMPEHREKAVAALTRAGFSDYYSKLAYDRAWIFRSTKGEVIVDIIWAMANQRAQVDQVWLERAGRIVMRGEELRVVPIEEFAWCKLYIVQRDRCDWIDVLNLLYCNGAGLDWEHLLDRLGEDLPLLTGIVSVYGWLHPERALRLPARVRRRLGIRRPSAADAAKWPERVRYLDSRAWFTALKARGERLEI